MPTVLLLDHDPRSCRSLLLHLKHAHCDVYTANDASELLAFVRRQAPDLLILDLDAPSCEEAWKLAERARQLAPQLLLIVLSGKARRRDDVIAGLQRGANAYLPRPVEAEEVVAHVHSLLRRTQGQHVADEQDQRVLRFGQLIIDIGQRRVFVDGEQATDVVLSPGEFDTLLVLARNVGKALPLSDLIALVQGESYAGDDKVLYTRIWNIRRKLAALPGTPRIATVHRYGYRLDEQAA